MENYSKTKETELVLKVKEVAMMFKLSPAFIRKQIESGLLPAYKVGAYPRPEIRIKKSEAMKWFEQFRVVA